MKTNEVKETPKPEQKPKVNLNYQRDKDREKVRGIFKNYEVPGGTFRFSFGPMYKGDQTENYEFEDGKIYTIPLGVAKHLNKNVWYPEHSYVVDEYGKPIARVGTKHRRVGFQSLEFVDIDDLTPQGQPLITVEHPGV
jgi:hypothetical protein